MRRHSVIAVLLVAVFAATAAPARAGTGTKVWNGTPVAAGTYQAVALVLTSPAPDRVEVCSGTLIADRYVVTAAHCVADVPGQPVDVALGGTSLSKPFDEVHTTRVHAVHSEWDSAVQHYDVALLELPKASKISPIRVARVDDEDLRAPGTRVALAGWGAVDGGDRGTGTLRDGATTVRPDSDCAKAYANYDPASMVCADGRSTDSCRGDSGGPLLARGPDGPILIGITSFGAACDVAEVGAYGWVPAARPWMEDVVAEGIGPFATRAGLKSGQSAVERRAAATLTVKLLRRSDDARLGRQAVELQHRGAGSSTWSTVDRASTTHDGIVRFSHTPVRDSEYRARHPGSAATRPSTSATVAVKVAG